MDQSELQTPLSERERDELRAVLESRPGAMSLVRADGFLTCIASAPTTAMPSAWFPMVLGDARLESIEQAQRNSGLLIRLFNQRLTDLNEGRGVRALSSFDSEDLAEWCGGYLAASRLDAAWKADEIGVTQLLPFAVLCGAFSLVGEEDADGELIEDATGHLEKYRRELPEYVLTVHRYWTEWRRNEMRLRAPTTPEPALPKVGRNSPCPCGSGKKFKRCCGR